MTTIRHRKKIRYFGHVSGGKAIKAHPRKTSYIFRRFVTPGRLSAKFGQLAFLK